MEDDKFPEPDIGKNFDKLDAIQQMDAAKTSAKQTEPECAKYLQDRTESICLLVRC